MEYQLTGAENRCLFVSSPASTSFCLGLAVRGKLFSDLLLWRVMTGTAQLTLTFSMLNGLFPQSVSKHTDRQAGRQSLL